MTDSRSMAGIHKMDLEKLAMSERKTMHTPPPKNKKKKKNKQRKKK